MVPGRFRPTSGRGLLRSSSRPRHRCRSFLLLPCASRLPLPPQAFPRLSLSVLCGGSGTSHKSPRGTSDHPPGRRRAGQPPLSPAAPSFSRRFQPSYFPAPRKERFEVHGLPDSSSVALCFLSLSDISSWVSIAALRDPRSPFPVSLGKVRSFFSGNGRLGLFLTQFRSRNLLFLL